MVQSMVWQQALRKAPDRPSGRQHKQFDALLALSTLLDWPTGKGFASVRQVAKDSDASERTVKRAIIWARQHEWLVQLRRGQGHKPGAGYSEATASEWALMLPKQGASSTEQGANSSEQGVSSAEQGAKPTGPPPESTSSESTTPGAALSEAARVVLDRTNATPEEAQAIADALEADPNIISARAVLNAKTDAALKSTLYRHRQASKPPPAQRSVEEAINPEICEHGGAVGRCPMCRRAKVDQR